MAGNEEDYVDRERRQEEEEEVAPPFPAPFLRLITPFSHRSISVDDVL